MSTIDTPDEIGDRKGLTDALNTLIRTAEANGVDIEGGYHIDGAEGESDFGIEIYRVAARTD